jgi:hypothetical protein
MSNPVTKAILAALNWRGGGEFLKVPMCEP